MFRGGMRKQITADMLKIYKPISGLDWMNYRIVRKSDMTAHHIHKKEHGGKLEIPNIALLLPHAHQYLNLIECKDMGIYTDLNKIFKIVNQQGYEPDEQQRMIIEYLLQSFEADHKEERSKKGKLLIKTEYLQRGFYQ